MLIFPLINDTSRKIIHIDMDAFCVSGRKDNPELKESLLLSAPHVRLVDAVSCQLVTMRRENLACILPS